jgi:hypothetical protein
MSPFRRSDRYATTTDQQLHELLVVARLGFLHASSWGNDAAMREFREIGERIVTEHILRGIDVETGNPWTLRSP